MKQQLFKGQIFLTWSMFAIVISGCNVNQGTTTLTAKQSLIPEIPTSNFGVGNIASITRQDAANFTNEEIVRLLVSRWLESYKNDPASKDPIVAYSVEDIIIRNHPASSTSEIIATVTFSVQPITNSNNWGSIMTKISDKNDPWWHLGATFNVIPEGKYFKLRILFGYET
jgi:hypothetical protein